MGRLSNHKILHMPDAPGGFLLYHLNNDALLSWMVTPRAAVWTVGNGHFFLVLAGAVHLQLPLPF